MSETTSIERLGNEWKRADALKITGKTHISPMNDTAVGYIIVTS